MALKLLQVHTPHVHIPLELSVAAAVAPIAMKTASWWITGSVGWLSDSMAVVRQLASALFAILMVAIASAGVLGA